MAILCVRLRSVVCARSSSTTEYSLAVVEGPMSDSRLRSHVLLDIVELPDPEFTCSVANQVQGVGTVRGLRRAFEP